MRLTMKPGRSRLTITCLPSSVASSRTEASVASSVSTPRIISMSGMTGTGLKKWMPTTRGRRSSLHRGGQPRDAMELVLLARIALAGAAASISSNRSRA